MPPRWTRAASDLLRTKGPRTAAGGKERFALMWWFRLRQILARSGLNREARVTARAQARSAPGEPDGRRRTWYWRSGLALALLVLHLIVFPPVARLGVEFPAVGDIAEKEIRAPFSFEAPLPDREVQMQRLEKVVEVPPVLRETAVPGHVSGDRLQIWLDALAAELDDRRPLADRVGILTLQFPSVSPAELRRLLASAEPDSLVGRMARGWRRVRQGGLVDMLPAGKYDQVSVIQGQVERLIKADQVVTQTDLEERLVAELLATGLAPLVAADAASVMRPFLVPSLVYDPDATGARQDAAREGVPTTRDFIRGERIVDQGERVTEAQAWILGELEALIRSRGGDDDDAGRAARFLARTLSLGIALGLFAWLGSIHFRDHLRRPRTVLALCVVLALFLVGAGFALSRPGLGPGAVPVVLLSLITTVLFKDKVGYTMTLLAVLLLALLPGMSAGMIFSWIAIGMVTVVSVRRIQKRSQFYQTILLLTALSVMLILLEGAGAGQEFWSSGNRLLVGVFGPGLMVAFGLFLLPVIEPLVGVCSDLTLLELSDLNHPLLQRMALEAQGTYHHSQVVGQLAEHGARAIDANPLLTRVGALFHDIGKIPKPEYYVENQSPDLNKHDELSPQLSALVIAAHVKEGIELGRKWRLPQRVLDFIPEHHGTMVMEFFYHKALENESNETVKVDDFRYPGPKPRSRETAILMLADAVEAGTRSLARPTPSRIKEITKQIIDKRLLSGELDESDLRLSDLARIREAFVPLLAGIHHARIVYPGQRDQQAAGSERKGDRRSRT